MMSHIDTLMVLLFPFLDAIPFTLPRYWMFRDRLRIPFRSIVLLQLALSMVCSISFYCINLYGHETVAQWTTILRYTFMLVYLVLAFMLIKDSFPKLMFTWLLFVSWQFFVLGNANDIESIFFGDFSEQHPYLVYNICRILIYLITCPFLLHFFSHTITNALKIDDKKMWRHFWKIPMFSVMFGMLYCTVADVYAYATWQFIVLRYLMLLGVCYVSYVALKVLESSRNRIQLEDALRYADQTLIVQKKHYSKISTYIEQAQRARHDLRHQLATISTMIAHKNYEKLEKFVEQYLKSVPTDKDMVLCENYAANSIISHYISFAHEEGVTDIDIRCVLAQNSGIDDTDLCVLLGNLLENSIEGCMTLPTEKRKIKLRISTHAGNLLLTVDNTFDGKLQIEDGEFLSRKRKNGQKGVGLASVAAVAEKYDGGLRCEEKDGWFLVSVQMSVKG